MNTTKRQPTIRDLFLMEEISKRPDRVQHNTELVEIFLHFLYSDDHTPEEKYKMLSKYKVKKVAKYAALNGMPFVMDKISEIEYEAAPDSNTEITTELVNDFIYDENMRFNIIRSFINPDGSFNTKINRNRHEITRRGNNILRRLTNPHKKGSQLGKLNKNHAEWFHITYDELNHDGLYIEIGYGLFLFEELDLYDKRTSCALLTKITTEETIDIILRDHRMIDYYIMTTKKEDRSQFWMYFKNKAQNT